VGFDISFQFLEPTALVLMLYLHPSRRPTVRGIEQLSVDPRVLIADFIDGFGNPCGRAFVPAATVTFRSEAIVVDGGLPEPQLWDVPQTDVQDLPHDVLPYL
jgi:hypothetical protein